MKKILLSVVILSASVVAYSQDQKTTEPQPQPQTQVIKETDQKSYEAKQAEWDNLLKAELKLTEEQVTKIAVIKKEFTDKKEALMKDANLTDEARKEKKMALKKEKEAKFLEVLTTEQQTKYKQLLEAEAKKKEVPKSAN
jgi:hypothetical protein